MKKLLLILLFPAIGFSQQLPDLTSEKSIRVHFDDSSDRINILKKADATMQLIFISLNSLKQALLVTGIKKAETNVSAFHLYTTYSNYRTYSSKTLLGLESLQKHIKNTNYLVYCNPFSLL